MKNLIFSVIFIFLSIFSSQDSFALSVDLSQMFSGAVPGQGIQAASGELTPFSCVQVDSSAVQTGSNFLVKSDYLEIETLEELKKMMKGGFALSEFFQSKLEKSLSASKQNKVIKLTLSFLQKQEGKPLLKLHKNFEMMARNGLFIEFASSCGTEFISSIAKGHKLHIFMILSSKEEASSKEFEAVMKLNITQLLSKITGTEALELVLGKLELTAATLLRMQQLSRKIQLEYTIAMTGGANLAGQDRMLSMAQVPFPTGISDQFTETGNDLTQLLLIMTKRFPTFAMTEFRDNLKKLPEVEGVGELYATLLSNSYFGKGVGELLKGELTDFLQSNQEFSFFNSAFQKLEARHSRIGLLLSKTHKIENTVKLRFKRLKKFQAIMKFLQINKQSVDNIRQFCQSSSLVYPECFALAFGKAPESKDVGMEFLQVGNNFTCLEANDFDKIENCLDQGMKPSACKKLNFSQFNLEKNVCEKGSVDFLEDFLLPVQPKNF